MNNNLYDQAIHYHKYPKPGKLEITATKPLANQRDLALAYSPGVAAACEYIMESPEHAGDVTNKSNLVAVITNGTAVLGLGDIGPLAAKPVMEGKAVLFKKFAGIDVFDLGIDEKDPDKLIDKISSLECNFGGINLEDIKAPECFHVERALQKRMNIPVFHDDQHGTAIIVAAAIVNALEIVKKDLDKVKLVTSGAGAAALACLDILVDLGIKRENIWVTDKAGLVKHGREEHMDEFKSRYAQKSEYSTLGEVIDGADIFLGLSVSNILKPDMVKKMADKPIIMALSNPVPEILPEAARSVRPDAIIATGRSDYPNQVNNVLCFPFIFRGALDVGATCINEEMKKACVYALARLAKAETSDVVYQAYGDQELKFGSEYLIPKPFDPRLIVEIAPAVAKAAMDSGVAKKPIKDLEHYKQKLVDFVFRSGLVMKPIFAQAKRAPKRLVFAEGEEMRVLQAVQAVVDDKIAYPILIGRPHVVETRIKKLGLRIRPGVDFELVNVLSDPRYRDYWGMYHERMQRSGVSPDLAKDRVRHNTTVIASLMIERGEADAMICGTIGRYRKHLNHIRAVIGLKADALEFASLNAMILDKGTFFMCDTNVQLDPTAQQIANMTMQARKIIQRFGIMPKVALLSHSSFGTDDNHHALKMRYVREILQTIDPELEVEGEMHADAALSEEIRHAIFPNSTLKGQANLLVMPSLDAANITFNALKILGDGITVGPILLGCKKPSHILTPSTTVRGIINMAAFAVVEAQLKENDSMAADNQVA